MAWVVDYDSLPSKLLYVAPVTVKEICFYTRQKAAGYRSRSPSAITGANGSERMQGGTKACYVIMIDGSWPTRRGGTMSQRSASIATKR